jgi:hypothetical protein
MGKKSKTGVLKRLREVKKAEKAAMKREQLKERRSGEPAPRESRVATDEDMAGYGFPDDEEQQGDEEGSSRK